jgi:hypothetical protein
MCNGIKRYATNATNAASVYPRFIYGVLLLEDVLPWGANNLRRYFDLNNRYNQEAKRITQRKILNNIRECRCRQNMKRAFMQFMNDYVGSDQVQYGTKMAIDYVLIKFNTDFKNIIRNENYPKSRLRHILDFIESQMTLATVDMDMLEVFDKFFDLIALILEFTTVGTDFDINGLLTLKNNAGDVTLLQNEELVVLALSLFKDGIARRKYSCFYDDTLKATPTQNTRALIKKGIVFFNRKNELALSPFYKRPINNPKEFFQQLWQFTTSIIGLCYEEIYRTYVKNDKLPDALQDDLIALDSVMLPLQAVVQDMHDDASLCKKLLKEAEDLEIFLRQIKSVHVWSVLSRAHKDNNTDTELYKTIKSLCKTLLETYGGATELQRNIWRQIICECERKERKLL